MKAKHLIVLVVIAVIIIALGLHLHRRQQTRWDGDSHRVAGQPVLPDLDVNQIASIQIKDAQASLTLKKVDGTWQVHDADGYPADFEKIRKLLLDLKDLKIAQGVPGADKFPGRLNLLEPTGETIASGILVQLGGPDGEALHSLILGKDHTRQAQQNLPMGGNWPDGKYIRVQETELIGLVPNTFRAVTTEAVQWLNRAFIQAGEPVRVTVEEDGKTLWSCSRQDGTLTLDGEIPENKEVDPTAINSLNRVLSYASFADVAAKDAPDSETGMDNPRICRLVDEDGIQYTLRIGAKKDNNYYVRAEVAYVGPEQMETTGNDPADATTDQAREEADFAAELAETKKKVADLQARLKGWTYLVGSHTLDSLNKNREDFLKDKPEAEPEDKGVETH